MSGLPQSFINALPAMATKAGATGGDYKALVLFFLNGGNDAHNTVFNQTAAGKAAYTAGRPTSHTVHVPEASRIGLAGSLAGGVGAEAALHPAMTGIRDLFNAGKCAIVAQVGPLVEPLTKAEYGTDFTPGDPNKKRPLSLQSHIDQQQHWGTLRPDDNNEGTGWGGRTIDLMAAAFNPGGTLPGAITLAGRNRTLDGYEQVQYSIDGNSAYAVTIDFGGQRFQWIDNLEAAEYWATQISDPTVRTHKLEREYAKIYKRNRDNSAALAGGLSGVNPTTTFPTSGGAYGPGAVAKTAARLIKARAAFAKRREIFFIQIGGYDTHSAQGGSDGTTGTHADLLSALSAGIKALYDELVVLGLQNNVTIFTGSDFGRSLVPNGNGTDHGWGGHHFVIGGAVNGGQIYRKVTGYDTTVTTGSMPLIELGGMYDTSQGRFLPTTSVDEFYAPILKWFGIPDPQLDLVIPNLSNFPIRDMGFMAA